MASGKILGSDFHLLIGVIVLDLAALELGGEAMFQARQVHIPWSSERCLTFMLLPVEGQA